MRKSAQAAVLEARQSMLRVWMAISAVWVTFWLVIATLVAATFQSDNPLVIQLGILAIIVATPPFVLLAVGAVLRWIFEAVALPRRTRRPPS